MFLDTQPMQLDGMGRGLDEFRVHAPAELRSLLKRVQDGNVLINLNSAGGVVYTTTLWALDAARGLMTMSADGHDPRLQQLLEADEVVVVCYLDSIKLQFDLHGLVLVHSGRSSALQAAIPRVVYRFQRRGSFRVKPLASTTPTARMAHPKDAQQTIALRIVDISLGGCALFLPADVPSFDPGIDVDGVSMELDSDTRFRARLHVHHVTALNPDSKGSRLGCSMVRLPSDAERMLQRYIDQTQKRRRLLSLD